MQLREKTSQEGRTPIRWHTLARVAENELNGTGWDPGGQVTRVQPSSRGLLISSRTHEDPYNPLKTHALTVSFCFSFSFLSCVDKSNKGGRVCSVWQLNVESILVRKSSHLGSWSHGHMVTWSHGIHHQEATVDECKLSLSSISIYSPGCLPGGGATCGVCFFSPQQNQDNLLTGRPTGPPPRQITGLSGWQLSVPRQCPQALKPTCLCSTTSKRIEKRQTEEPIYSHLSLSPWSTKCLQLCRNSLHLKMDIKKQGRPIFILNMKLIFLISVT